MKYIFLVLIILIFVIPEAYSIKLREPKGRLKENNLIIDNWYPPTSLDSHVAHGTDSQVDPFFYFNLNLGYLRIFTKSNIILEKKYLINSGFPFIVEFKPFDFFSFLFSGSSYALFVERNEWLRNLTFIISNRVDSSTQFITSFMLWYGDLVSSAFSFKGALYTPSIVPTSSTTLEVLYPTNRNISLGVSDRIHIYQSARFALGLLAYFEFNIPEGKQDVVAGEESFPLSVQAVLANYNPSERFTFSTMGGIFVRFKNRSIDFKARMLYLRRQGDFDAWAIAYKQNTGSLDSEITLHDRFVLRFKYFLVQWKFDVLEENTISHIINLGEEIKGFGKGFEWFGVGFDFNYHNHKQDRDLTGFQGRVDGISLIPSVSWYPLAFHERNHTLKFSFYYAFFYMRKYSSGAPIPKSSIPSVNDPYDWHYAIMLRASYSF